MTKGNWNWLDHPDLEEKIASLDALPPDLDRLVETVRRISEASGKEIRIKPWMRGATPVVSFDKTGTPESYNVSVEEARYCIAYQYAADRSITHVASTAQLAWKILGFPFSPADACARLERAKELSISYAPGVVPLGMPRAKPQKKIAAATRKPGTSRAKRLSGVPIGIGIAAGISIGDASHNVFLGVAIGALIGVAVNAGMQKWKVS
jgi:hypothetical protein